MPETELERRSFMFESALRFAPLFHPLTEDLFTDREPPRALTIEEQMMSPEQLQRTQETARMERRQEIARIIAGDREMKQSHRDRMMEVTFERLGIYGSSDRPPSHAEIAAAIAAPQDPHAVGPRTGEGTTLSRERIRQIEAEGRRRINLSRAAWDLIAASRSDHIAA